MKRSAVLFLLLTSCSRAPSSEAPAAAPSAIASAPASASSSAPAAPPVPPARPALSDRDFGRLVAKISEPTGKFPSDNFVSNETSWAHVVPALDDASLHGGAYVGVGPEQSFAYLAILDPELAFLLDIRRQNLVEHLLYKTLFEQSASRADFLVRLLSRKAPGPMPGDDATLEQLSAWVAKLPGGEGPRRAVLDRVAELGIELSKDDVAHLDATLKAFAEKGLDIRYSMEGSARKYPSLGELSATRDASGKARSFLAAEDVFRKVQRLERDNRIVPVVGDLAGTGAMPRIAADLRERSLSLHVLYSSNVEQYLFSPQTTWASWVKNVAAMPWAPGGKILRVYFDQGRKHPQQVEGHRTVSMLVSEDHFVKRAQEKKGYASWWDVATDRGELGGCQLSVRVVIRGVRADEVAHPAERAARAEPEARRDDQPEDAAQERAVVDLPNARHEQREHASDARLRHAGKMRTDSRTARRAPADRSSGAWGGAPMNSLRGQLR